jgi:YVTN family beta-propeller protein
MIHLPVCDTESDSRVRRDLKSRPWARLLSTLVLLLGATSWPGAASAWTGQPLAYVSSASGILVIDTGDNKVVNTIPGPNLPTALSSDGKYLFTFGPASDLVANITVINTSGDGWVTAVIPLNLSAVNYPLSNGASLNQNSTAMVVSADNNRLYVATGLCPFPGFACHPESVYFVLWEIDLTTKTVVANSVGKGIAEQISLAPDGQQIYIANFDPYYLNPQVLVVATGNTVSLPGTVIPIPALFLQSLAVTPNGKRLYVPYSTVFVTPPSNNVAVISTATNTLTQPIVLEANPQGGVLAGVVVTPNGKFVYVANQDTNSVAVIRTANNAVVKTIPVGAGPAGLAITPDGAHLYVANAGGNSVSVIETLSNKVIATIPGSGPTTISIVSPPQGAGGVAINADLLVSIGHQPKQDGFDLGSSITAPFGQQIQPATVPLTLQVGPFFVTLPAESFVSAGGGTYLYDGFVNNGVHLQVKIVVSASRFAFFHAKAENANLGGIANPVQVSIGIGPVVGLTETEARISPSP